jgi:hypothetical protein
MAFYLDCAGLQLLQRGGGSSLMIVEERIYTCYCGKASQYVKMYEAEGLAIQRPP